MSVPVSLEELQARIEEFGSHPYLVTTGEGGRVHIASVPTRVEGDRVVVDAGRTSRANAVANPSVSLLWAPRDGGPYSLIVDGTATARGESVAVTPERAVLHRVAGADGGIAKCVEVGVSRQG